MKAKALMYAKKGDDVITKTVDLEKIGEHLYSAMGTMIITCFLEK